MSSSLSKHQLSPEAIRPYLRGYKHAMPVSPDEWAAAETLGLEVGTLIFSLEPIIPLTASTDQQQQPSGFKVTELAVVIGRDNERPIVLRVTAETYELVFLEKLMLSAAQDAKLIGHDFAYTLVEPAGHLPEEQIQKFQQLAYSFAQGGSRREKNQEWTGPIDPSIALLTALGLQLESSAYKQLLDIGLFCQQLFEEQPTTGSPMSDVKARFHPLPATGATTTSSSIEAQPIEEPRPEPQNLPQPAQFLSEEAHEQSQIEPALSQLETALHATLGSSLSEPIQQDQPAAALSQLEAALQATLSQTVTPAVPQHRPKTLEIKAPPPLDRPARTTVADTAEEGLDPWEKMLLPKATNEKSAKQQEAPLQAEQPQETDQPIKSEDAVLPESLDQLHVVAPPQQEVLLQPPTSPKSLPKPRSTPDSRATKGSGSVETVMESLVARLEQQVSKATSNLVSQMDQIHNGLENDLQQLSDRALQQEESSEATLRSVLDDLNKRLDELAEESRLRISDAAAADRYTIKQIQERGQRLLDEAHKESVSSLNTRLTALQDSLAQLFEATRRELDSVVSNRISSLSAIVDAICQQLNYTNQEFSNRLKARFEVIQQRLEHEGKRTKETLVRHVDSLTADLQWLNDRAFEKLQTNTSEHVSALDQAVRLYEHKLSDAVTRLNNDTLIPKLREYRESLWEEQSEKENQLETEATETVAKDLFDMEQSATGEKAKLHQTLSNIASRMENLAAQHKENLANIYQETAESINGRIAQTETLFQEAESKSQESERLSRELVEASATGANPSILEGKENALNTARQVKKKAVQELETTVDEYCSKLHNGRQAAHSALKESRTTLAQSVANSADEALNLIRATIQDASASITATQEKYMQ